ncbi:hypothetical protein H6501_03095 [Candidatus Woesearchaeota archaeon]|nr:hypothetical protein [Candidatus Woesearchaeota archaeon]
MSRFAFVGLACLVLFLLPTLFAADNGNATSECESENSFSCSANTLYRCVNDGSGKLVKKAELFCSANYACSADQGRCVLANGYSIRLDYSLEQQNVYKKHGSSFVARLQIEGTAYGSPLVYDTDIFSSECPSGSPISGSYKECLFTVKSGAPTGETLIKHGPAIATLEILDDSEPAVNLYLTHSERMVQEYGEDSRDTVDLIVTKLYGKAAKEKGIVMDLAAYEKAGDFAAPYTSMGEYLNDIQTKGGRREIDSYVDEVAGRVRQECSGCENVLIVGSDFVVPGARDEYTFGNVYGFGSEEKAYLTSDAVYATNTYADLSFAELESYFSATNPSGSPAAKNVIFSLPLGWTKDTPEFQELIAVLDELHNNGSIFYDIHAVYEYDDVSCNDYWDLEDGTLIIIGNISNNRLFSCYHNENYEIGEGLMALDRNLWADKSEVALLVNDVGLENVIKILETGEYKNLEGTTYNILFWTNKARGYINVLPVAGPVVNFLVTDTIESYILTSDACSHVTYSGSTALDCTIGSAFIALDIVTLKGASKSGIGKGIKKFALEIVEDGAHSKRFVDLTKVYNEIAKKTYYRNLRKLFKSCSGSPCEPPSPVLEALNLEQRIELENGIYDTLRSVTEFQLQLKESKITFSGVKFDVNPDMTKAFQFGDRSQYVAIKNLDSFGKNDNGVLVYNKETGVVFPLNREPGRSFDQILVDFTKNPTGPLDSAKNFLRETAMAERLLSLGHKDTVFLHQIKAAYPDLAVFDAETGKIKLLANSGSAKNDDWETMGKKLQEIVTDGFSFENELNFHLSRDFEEVNFLELSKELKGIDFSSSTGNKLIFRPNENGPEVHITFIQEGGIN